MSHRYYWELGPIKQIIIIIAIVKMNQSDFTLVHVVAIFHVRIVST